MVSREWVNIKCDCGPVFNSQDEYDEHLKNKTYCKCGKEFDSTHDWRIHMPACDGINPHAVSEKNKTVDFIGTLGQFELKTKNHIIIILNNPDEDKAILFAKLYEIEPNAKFTINEGKLIADFTGFGKVNRKQYYNRKGKTDKDKGPEENRKVRRGGLRFSWNC